MTNRSSSAIIEAMKTVHHLVWVGVDINFDVGQI